MVAIVAESDKIRDEQNAEDLKRNGGRLCFNCAAFSMYDGWVDDGLIEGKLGRCRRYAPGRASDYWPEVIGSNWCLEWVDKEQD